MIDSIERNLTNYRRRYDDSLLEVIELSYQSNNGANLNDANEAARILIAELADFEPPIEDVSLADIDFLSDTGNRRHRVRYARTDASTVIAPGYSRQGYYLDEATIRRFNEMDLENSARLLEQ